MPEERNLQETLNYRGYIGNILWDVDGVYYGRIQHIVDIVTYEGKTLKQLKRNFENRVDEYLEFLEETTT